MTRGVIATPHWLATEAGVQVLREGGNAVDAAIAANAVLCVAYPHLTSLGGDLFALVWPAEAEAPVGLAGAGRSGSLATLETLWERGYREKMPERGILPVTVPGTVEAWGRLLETFGTMGLEPLMAPAAALAREGYPVTAKLATFLSREAEWLQMDPETRRLLPALKDGMALRNPDLAGTLEDIGRNGFNGFYRGEIGQGLAEAIRRRDGLVTAEDLAAHRSAWVEPVALEYRGLTVYEMPPPTQGLAAAAMLKRLEAMEPELLHPGLSFARELLRVRDQVYPLRERYITDPDFADIPWAPFLEPSLADAAGEAPPIPEGDTVYLCTADEHGNLVSLIQSVAGPFGSGVIAEGTGVLLHNRGKYFSLRPDHVNRLEPRKRTMHTLIPALAGRGGRPWAAFGARGADGQPQIQVQVLINLVDRGLDPREAVAAPRLLVPPGGGGLLVEADYPEAREILRAVPGAVPMPPGSWQMGHAQALVVERTASWRAGTDPRADGSVGEA